MPFRSPTLLAAPCLAAGIAVSASAIPLTYDVVPPDSNTRVGLVSEATLDVTPDITSGSINGEKGQFPFSSFVSGQSNTQPNPSSTLLANTGIPGNFDGGANGITISDLAIRYNNVPGALGVFTIGTTLAGLGIIPGAGPVPEIPFGVGETELLVFLATIQVSSLNIVLNEPFSSDLTEDPLNPGKYLWAGPANVTLSGEFKPAIDLAPMNPDPVPFEIPVENFPLIGTFFADNNGSEVIVGLDSEGAAALTEDQRLLADPIELPVSVPVSALGLEEALLAPLEEILGPVLAALMLQDIYDALGEDILVDLSIHPQLILDANGFEVHYVNSTPVPEPGSAALLALGCIGLAARRRRRSG